MSNKVEEGSKLKIGHWNSKIDPYRCEVCNVYANCQKTYDLHLNGRKHKENQMRNKNYEDKNEYKFHCEVCDVYIHTQETYDVHLAGQKHQKKLQNQFRLLS